MGLSFPAIAFVGEKKILGAILVLAILHGIVFIALVPPWQHYDEPGHFEYVWLLANRNGIPEAGEYDQGMRREVAASMIEHDFFAPGGFYPNLVSQSEPIWIGISQTGDVPLYYWLVSLPLRLVRTSDITFQLYLGRLVSLMLYAASVIAAYGLVAEITKQGSILRWLVPLSLVCMPGYTDLMTAVNNDVGAAAFFAFFLWASLRIMIKGFNLRRLMAIILTTALCAVTKSTVWAAVFLAPLPVCYALFRGAWRRWALAGVAIAYLLLVVLILSPDGMASWYAQGAYKTGQRKVDEQAAGGRAVLSLPVPDSGASRVYQPLAYSQVEVLRGQVVTLGAWIWADQPVQARVLVLQDASQQKSEEISIGETPQFYAISATIDQETGFINVILRSHDNEEAAGGRVFFDDVILVAGDFVQKGQPQMEASSAPLAVWSGEQVTNLVRNPSFERPWLQVRARLMDSSFIRLFPRLSQSVTSLSDLSSSSWYYVETGHNLFRTFWGKFGWGQVLLAGKYTYLALGVVTVTGLVGAVLSIWRRRKSLPWAALSFFMITMALVWGAALLRGIESLAGEVFIGSSRYAFPVMIPTLLLLCAGWLETITRIRTRLGWPLAATHLAYWVSFLGLDILSWWSIWRYYSSLP